MQPRPNYIQDIIGLLQEARSKAYRAVNTIMVQTYWQIGARIVLQEQAGEGRAAYGEGIIKSLSKALTAEFGKGFSVANLKNFRQFYLTFPDFQKSYALRSQLTWTHYRSIMRVEKPDARAFTLFSFPPKKHTISPNIPLANAQSLYQLSQASD